MFIERLGEYNEVLGLYDWNEEGICICSPLILLLTLDSRTVVP